MTDVKGVSKDGEHMLIPVTAKTIHSSEWNSEQFILKDGRPLHMVKLVGAVRYSCVNIKHIQLDVEDGTGLVRVILWRKQEEYTTQHCLIDNCTSNCYIRVLREVKDYYGVDKIIAFDV